LMSHVTTTSKSEKERNGIHRLLFRESGGNKEEISTVNAACFLQTMERSSSILRLPFSQTPSA